MTQKPKIDLTGRGPDALKNAVWGAPRLYARRYDETVLDLFVFSDKQYDSFRDALNEIPGEDHYETY